MPVDFFIDQTADTGQAVRLIVLGLLTVATALALATAYYWRVTDPRASDATQPPPPESSGGGRRRRRAAPEKRPDPSGPAATASRSDSRRTLPRLRRKASPTAGPKTAIPETAIPETVVAEPQEPISDLTPSESTLTLDLEQLDRDAPRRVTSAQAKVPMASARERLEQRREAAERLAQQLASRLEPETVLEPDTGPSELSADEWLALVGEGDNRG